MSRPYSTRYTARANPRRYLLSGIPPTLWNRARVRAKREGIAMRSLILHLLETWLDGDTLESEPHQVSMEPPTDENDPVGRFHKVRR